jgi:transcriptional regulator GlxA family with amidase domain
MPHVAFLLVPQFHVLDLAGPAQAFSAAADFGLGYELSYVADAPVVPTAQGLSVQARPDWPDLGRDDLVLVPGWRSPADSSQPGITAEQAQRLRDHHSRRGAVASVCSGAFALAAAGLLDGRRCTTHHALQHELARRYPKAHVVPDVLYVSDGTIVTSAGIASGIDLALHLVAMRHGPAAAARVAREMVVFARRNGHEAQASVMLRYRSHLSDVVHRAQDLIDGRPTERLTLNDLAGATGVSVRTLTRLFGDAIGMTPLQYQHHLRIERAEHLIGHGSTVDAAARAVGFADARMLRRLRSRRATARQPQASFREQ